jgi:hypothetical protein
LPPGRNLTWRVSVPVRADTPEPDATFTLGARRRAAASASDTRTLVILRDGFDVPYADGARIVRAQADAILDGDTTHAFALPPSGERLDTVLADGSTPPSTCSARRAMRRLRSCACCVARLAAKNASAVGRRRQRRNADDRQSARRRRCASRVARRWRRHIADGAGFPGSDALRLLPSFAEIRLHRAELARLATCRWSKSSGAGFALRET